MGGYSAAVAVVGYNAWWKDNSGAFHLKSEGWLEQDSYHGGADKFGHMYTAYISTRLLSYGLRQAGNSPDQALYYAAWTTGLTTLGIELLDGFTDEFGFSYEDMVFNLAGIASANFFENNPWWDQRFDFRFHYRQSADSRRLNKGDVMSDYSGQSYLLIAKLNGFSYFKKSTLLRYLELGVGYGARGYSPQDELSQREQKLLFSVSLNLSELLNQSLYKKQNHPRLKQSSELLFEYVQIPATTVMYEKKM